MLSRRFPGKSDNVGANTDLGGCVCGDEGQRRMCVDSHVVCVLLCGYRKEGWWNVKMQVGEREESRERGKVGKADGKSKGEGKGGRD